MRTTHEGVLARRSFLRDGKLGQLIDHQTATLMFDPIMHINEAPDELFFEVYDNEMAQWKNLHKYEIPKTYSYLPVPKSCAIELDYFIRTCCLIKHKIIWCKDSLPRADFGKITSKTNSTNLGRFTVAPWLPNIRDVAHKMKNGFYEFSDQQFFYDY